MTLGKSQHFHEKDYQYLRPCKPSSDVLVTASDATVIVSDEVLGK